MRLRFGNRSAHAQGRREHLTLERRLISIDARQNQPRSGASHLVERLGDRGDPRPEEAHPL